MTVRKSLRFGIGVLIAAAFLWLTLRQLEFDKFGSAIEAASVPWLLAAASMFLLGYACRIERWRLMLARTNAGVSWVSCAGPLMASFAVNNVLPFRAGDLLRSFAFNAKLGTTPGTMIATLVVERLLDLLAIVLVLGAALATFGTNVSSLVGTSALVLILGSAAILFLLFYPAAFAPITAVLRWLALRVPTNFTRRLCDEIDKSAGMLQHLARGSTMVKLLAWTLLSWLAEGCVFWFAALSLPSILTPAAGWLALPVGTLATLIPSTPGYVGTFDYFVMRTVAAFGNEPAAAAAYTFLAHMLLWVPPTMIGGSYLLLQSLRRRHDSPIIGHEYT